MSKVTCIKIVVIAFLFFSKLNAQHVFNQFIGAALQEGDVKIIDDQMRYLNGKPYRLSPIQRLELRTESNQLDPERQDYALRVNPANPWELKSNNLYFKEYREYLHVKKQMALKESLYERYMLLAELIYTTEMQNLRRRESELLASYVSVLERQQLSGLFDDKDYVDLKLEQVEASVELDEITFERGNILHKISTSFSLFRALDFQKADSVSISPEEIHALITDSLSEKTAPLIVKYYTSRINLAEHEYALEKNNVNFGFLQAQYQEFRIEQDRNPWSVSLGVTIPIFNPNKGDMTRRKMDMYEEAQEREEEQQQYNSTQSYLRQKLKTQLLQYQQTKEKIKSLKESRLATVLNTKYDQNPTMQIRFSQNILKLDELTIKLKLNIYNTYIELLSTLDLLHEQPLRNHFSKDLQLISQ